MARGRGGGGEVTLRRSEADRFAASAPLLSLLLGLAVAIPILVAGVRLASDGWNPTVDDATIATRSYDVLTDRSPLVGQYSMAAKPGTPPAHSPGPILYWLLSVPARFGPSWSLPVFMAAVNAALVVLVVVLARRRGGLGLAVVTAVGVGFLVRSIGLVTLTDIWNPYASLLPFLALVFLVWSVADGERWLLPAVVLAASFVMQTHLTYVMPSLALLVVAVVGGWWPDLVRALFRRRGEIPDPVHERGSGVGPLDVVPVAPADDGAPPTAFAKPAVTRRRMPSPFLLAVVVGVACWIVPLVQQFTGDPGNLGIVLRAGGSSDQRGGMDALRASVGRAVGVPPRWLRPHAGPISDILEGLRPAGSGFASALLVVLVLAVVTGLALRRRDRLVVAAGATSAALLVGMVGVAASLPLDRGLIAGYSFMWFRVAGFFIWLATGLGIVRALVPAWSGARAVEPASPWTDPAAAAASSRRSLVRRSLAHADAEGPAVAAGADRRRIPAGWVTGAVAVIAVAIVAVGLLLPRPDPTGWTYRPADRLGDAVEAATKPGQRYFIAPTVFDVTLSPAVVWRLRTTGRLPIVRARRVPAWGDEYGASGVRCAGIVAVNKVDAPLAPGARTLATVDIGDQPGLPSQARLDLAPDRTESGLC